MLQSKLDKALTFPFSNMDSCQNKLLTYDKLGIKQSTSLLSHKKTLKEFSTYIVYYVYSQCSIVEKPWFLVLMWMPFDL